jgi:hypothetical protein
VCNGVIYAWYGFPGIPDRADETVTLGPTTNSTITVSWQQIKNLPSVPEGYYKYLVDYRTSSDPYKRGPTVNHVASQELNTATVYGLVHNTEYDLRVTPFREMRGQEGRGNTYDKVTTRTRCNGKFMKKSHGENI